MTTGTINTTRLAGTQNYVANSFAAAITRLMPNGTAPLFGLTSMLQTETAVQVEHGFFTKTAVFPSLTLGAAVADGAANTFTTTNTNFAVPGSLYRAQSTGEVVIINTVASSTSVTVTRGVGNVAAGAIASGVRLYYIGSAFEEASTRPNSRNIAPVRITNLTQIFRDTWAVSGSAAATQVIAGDTPVAENRQDCATFHATGIETSLFFGQKSSGTRNGQPFRTMDGLISLVGNLTYYPSSYSAANIFTAGSTTNYTQLENMLDPTLNQVTDPTAGNQRMIFCGSEARKVFNNIGRLNGQYQLVDGQTSYGLQFASFKIARGTFNMVEHPLFNSNPDWARMAIVLDLSSFRLAYLNGRQTSSQDFNMNGTPVDNGIDAVGGTLTTELTCVLKNPPANAVISNLTAAAVG